MKNKLRNYEIREKLGSGSYGIIYKIIDKTTKSIYVLKEISLTRMTQKAKKNAVNQATVLKKLNHPFVVEYIDSFIDENSLNIIMEYCDGGDLSIFLKNQGKKPLKQQKIWKIFIQICMGLDHIHQRKILHRDIKTLNIFMTKDDSIKIGDLGVAKMLQGHDFAQTMVGTPFYLSPQLCQQKPYNQKSDIWALGCLLYELCTYQHPFQANNQATLILKIVRGKYIPIPQFYSKDLKEMIDWCLERDYKRRPTAQMILQKPKVKQMVDFFKLNDNQPKQQSKIISNIVQLLKNSQKQQKKQLVYQEPSKAQVKVVKALDIPAKIQKITKQMKPILEIKEQKQLKSQNKSEFISNLQKYAKNQQKKSPLGIKKPSVWIQSNKINGKDDKIKKAQVIKPKQDIFAKPPLPEKKQVLKGKVEKVIQEKIVQAKVYESNKNLNKAKSNIKSGGFQVEEVKEKSKSKDKIKQKIIQQQFIPRQILVKDLKQQIKIQSKQKKHFQIQSQKNLIKQNINNQKQQNLIKINLPLPPRVRKGSKNQLSRNAKLVSTKNTQITQQQKQQVLNLPEIVKPSIKQDQQSNNFKCTTNLNANFQLQELISNQMIISQNEAFQQQKLTQQYEDQTPQQNQQQQIQDNSIQYLQSSNNQNQKGVQNKLENQVQQQIQQEQLQNEEKTYQNQQSNNQNQNQNQNQEIIVKECNEYLNSQKQQGKSEWSFDEEPQLPLLQDVQHPFFQQANPYLMEQKAGEETQKDKIKYYKIKLQQNLKRQEQLNKLMHIKIRQCKQSVPQIFEEILSFFRKKINMQSEYTQKDQKQVESFVKRKGLTDHRKFQNIYKIMHFEMEIQNTRQIIQKIKQKISDFKELQ